MVLNYKGKHVIDNWTGENCLFTVCAEQVRSLYTEHAASGLPEPTHLEGEVRFVQAQDQQVLPHVVREFSNSVYSLARCWLKCIYMYVIFTVCLSYDVAVY